jgi:hypothetical protein
MVELLQRCRNPLVIQLLVICVVALLMDDIRSAAVVSVMILLRAPNKMNSHQLQASPADETAAKLQERLVYIGTALEANTQPAKLMQPRICALHDPTRNTQTTTVFGTAASNDGDDTAHFQGDTMRIGIISAIALQRFGFALRASDLTRYGRNAVNQRNELSNVVVIGGCQDRIQRNALRVRDDMVLATRTTAIGWVRSSFFPAPTARIEELSTTAREKSNRSAPRSFASSTSCSRCQTPRRCHCFNRRQHVMPEPQPISLGSISQGIPDFSTNKIPISTRLLHSGLRPAYRLRRRFLGNSGPISAHKSSSINDCGIVPSLGYAMPHRTNVATKVQDSFC